MTPSQNATWLPSASNTRSAITAAAAMVGICVLARLLPHPPNVSPLASMALFGGAFFASTRMAIAVPLLAMLLSDLVLGFHGVMWAIYGAFIVSALMGRHLRSRPSVARLAGATLASSIAFFVITNLAVWMMWYPPTFSGLATCFTVAIPFFQNSLAGNVFFTTVLFGSAAMIRHTAMDGYRVPAVVRVR